MKKYVLLSFVLVLGFLFSCQKNTDVVPADVPARTAQEAKARLTAQNKWTIDEALFDGKLAYKRGQTKAEDADIELEWCRFADDGSFEIKTIGDPVPEKLFYKIDQANNRIIIGYDDQFKNAEDWTIKAGSVYSAKFDMELKDDDELVYLKMVAIP